MALSRRRILAVLSSVPILGWLQPGGAKALAVDLESSPFAYISPFKSNKQLSRCQAEVWYVSYQGHIHVCSDSKSWRVRALSQGLDRARIWLGDVGEWLHSNEAYKSLPAFHAKAEIVSDGEALDKLLDRFGDKYPLEWLLWHAAFRSGIADGSRTMLRYTVL